ncbi:MAG: DUF6531 domain-containing protein [Planctomycetota bacterium]|nr:DUF6531 domain-containing protein [Planctomycetota bacterium]
MNRGSATAKVVNLGTIRAEAAGKTITVQGQSVSNSGTLEAKNGGTLALSSVSVENSGTLRSSSTSSLVVNGNLTGNTTNSSQFVTSGALRLSGNGSAALPQLLEVMGRDLGGVAAGFANNFAHGTLALGGSTYVKLVDESHNASGTGAEALYVNSLIVPAGTILNLNGLNVYARAAQISGAVIGTTLNQIPDSGALLLSTPTPGAISTAGELDEWQIFGRAGRSMTIVVNPGGSGSPVPQPLNWAEIQLLDSANNVLGTATSTSPGAIVMLSDMTLPADGTYKIRIRASSGHTSSTGGYLVTAWDATPAISTLNVNQITIGNIGTPFSVNRWNFSASAGQQVRFDLKTSVSGLAFSLLGPNSYSGFTDIETDSPLITLPSSGTYTLVAHGLNGAIGNYAFVMQQTFLTDLQPGALYSGAFGGSEQAELFRINLTASSPLRLNLDDSTNGDQTEMYLKLGSSPTRSDYTYRSAGGADQQILVSVAAVGNWYALVYGAYVPTPSTYTLVARTSAITLAGVSPGSLGNVSPADLTITGAGFDSSCTVSLVAANATSYPASSVSYDSFTQVTATFAAGSVPPGLYTLRISNTAGQSAELPDAFRFLPGGQAKLQTQVIVPNRVGYHQLATIYVEYANTGTLAMPAPLLSLQPTQNGRAAALLTLDSSRISQGFWTTAIPAGFSNTVDILVSGQTPGLLLPGESFRVPIYWAGWQQPWDMSYPVINFNLATVQADSTEPIDWSKLKDSMRPASFSTQAWDAIFDNFTAQVGSTWGDYVSMLDDNASYLGKLGESISDIGQLLSYEVMQADGLSLRRTLVSAQDLSVDSPGMALSFSRFYSTPISQRCELGPLGRGWAYNWQTALSVAGDGTVVVTVPGGGQRVFQPDARSSDYFAQAGDHGALTATGGGTFQLREPDGRLAAYRADGKLNFMEDTNGNRITAGYTDNLLTSLTHSSGRSLQIAWNVAGRIERITDPFGRITAYGYDVSGEHLIAVQDMTGQTTAYSYVSGNGPSAHALIQITYPGGTHEYFSYDEHGRLARTALDGNAEAVNYTYDSTGGIYATNALGASTSTFIGHQGLVFKTEDAHGNATHLAYDQEYNLIGVTDPAGRSYAYGYDVAGNLISTTDPLGYSTTYNYVGPYSSLAQVTDANDNVTRLAYDSHGNRQSVTYASGGSYTWTYNTQGEASSWTNARGQTLTYTYDSDGHLESIAYPDGSHAQYNYDAHGNMTSASNSAGTVTLDYDAADRLTLIAYPNGQSLAFTYNAAGQRLSSVDQTEYRLTYGYDAAGRLASLTDATGLTVVAISYDAAGNLVRKDFGNSSYTVYTYDGDGRLLHQKDRGPSGSTLSTLDITYDSRGRRTALITPDGSWAYSYDDNGQLTQAIFTSTNLAILSQDLAYSYDAVGNRTRVISNGTPIDYTSNALNQYALIGNTGYTYDACGNLVLQTGPGGTTQYSYDPQNRLIGATSGADAWQYIYDALGNRVASTANGATSYYLVDPIGLGNMVGQFDASGNAIAHWDYEYGLISRTLPGGARGYYTFGEAGNTTRLVADSGAVANSYAWLPFGQPLANTVTVADPFQFNGQFGVTQEGSGLIFMRARNYDPATGHFASRDPIGILGGINLYAYAGNSPISSVDPSGLCEAYTACMGSAVGTLPPAETGSGSGNIEAYLNDLPNKKKKAHEDCMKAAASTIKGALFRSGPGILGGIGGAAGVASCGHAIKPPRPPAGNGPVCIPGQPCDPNDKFGPVGYGAAGFVSGTQSLPYRVDFENDSKATAPAQYVDVTDQLNNNLDWTTFKLTELGFGDTVISVPANSQHFETSVLMDCSGRTIEVQIRVGIDLATGKVRAQFSSIDPTTGLPPDVLTGFLPPENGTGRGQGYFTYIVQPKAGLMTGTQIRNIAVIQFDFGESIATNQISPHDPSKGVDPAKECLNTIDSLPPSSHVATLLPQSWTTDFVVSWIGEDDSGGSGVGGYDIYVSDNGGPFTLWMNATTDTSALFTGQPFHTYAFYSVARDNVGHVEAAPAAPDAQTMVSGDTIWQGEPGDDQFAISLDAAGAMVQLFLNQNLSFTVPLSQMMRLAVDGIGGHDMLTVDLTNGNPLRLSALHVPSGYVQLRIINGSTALRTSGLAIGQGAKLNLADNDVIVSNGDIAVITEEIKSGRIIGKGETYTSLAAILNDTGDEDHTPIKTSFAGQNVLASDVLVKYTWDGDANLDGVINADDYFQIDSGYITQAKGYQNGDFNYDGVINADDYFLIDSAYIGQSGPLAASNVASTMSADTVAVRQQEKKTEPESILAQLFSSEPVL